MLHRLRDNMPLARGLDRRMNRRVIAFRGAGCKHNFAGTCPDQFGHLPARYLNDALEFRPKALRAGRVPPIRPEIWQHRLQYLRQHRRRGIMVQIDHYAILCHPTTHAQPAIRRHFTS